jgi:hypothetical protein
MKTLILVILMAWGFQVHAAQDFGIELGMRQQAGDVVALGQSANSQAGFQGGVFYHHPLEGGVAHWRTGLLYTQRPLQSENDTTGEKFDYHLDYIDIPFDILFKPQENIGFYFGFNVAINIAKSCSGPTSCKITDVNTPLFPVVFGMTYKFTPKWGVDFYVDGVNSYDAKFLADYRSAGLNLMFSFD